MKTSPLNEANFAKREFKELWGRINHRAVYQVEFDSNELIAKALAALDSKLNVSGLQYVVEHGRQLAGLDAEQLKAGKAFKVAGHARETEQITASSSVKYDLLGEITEKTQLTRRTVSAILRGIRSDTFGKFRLNPEQFITETARLINEEKATVIVEHLTWRCR